MVITQRKNYNKDTKEKKKAQKFKFLIAGKCSHIKFLLILRH